MLTGMLTSYMSRIMPEHRSTSRVSWLYLLLPLMGCAAPKPQLAVSQPPAPVAPLYTGTIAAIRPESSAQDPTGSLQQIMTILGQPAPQPANASEIIMRMPDNSIKTSVQAPQPALAAGSKVAVMAGSTAALQPY
jgi:hypothetical protein